MSEKHPQPAIKSYYFDQGYKDLKSILSTAWQNNATTASTMGTRISATWQTGGKVRILICLCYVIATISMYLFGTIFFGIIAAVHVLVLMMIMLVVYIGCLIIALLDRLYLSIKKISVDCTNCHKRFLYPVYICPECGAKHDKLTPGAYGIMHRRCECGAKLPTSFLNVKFKRKQLESECPYCGTSLNAKETRPMTIPVVGGASVGKTAFINAFAIQFVEEVALDKDFEVDMYNDENMSEYNMRKKEVNHGLVTKTPVVTDITKPSSIAFSFFLKHEGMDPDRLVHIYDIAGETFSENAENELQKQYEHCDGIVMMIDPFSIPSVNARYESEMDAADIASISAIRIDDVLDSFLNKLQQITGLSENKLTNNPIAIVINKVDVVDLDNIIGDSAIQQAMKDDSGHFNDYYNTMDYLCKKFLLENDMGDVVQNIQMKFKQYRFFSCSAMGHTIGKGRYYPKGVLPVMEWIIAQNDKKLYSYWNETQFPTKTYTFSLTEE